MMDHRNVDTAAAGPAPAASGRLGRARRVVAVVVLATVVVACQGGLPSALPSVPAVVPSFEPPSLPALPSVPAKPTEKPTAKPTAKPTEKPTAQPTEKPTEAPTEAPSPEATAGPSTEATPEPTPKPTEKPTATATAKPTAKPAASESSKPTPTATPKPTPTPTPKPTPTPTPTEVTVTGGVDVGFIASSLSGPPPLAVKFSGHVVVTVDGVTTAVPVASETTTAQLWTFGDGGISFDPDPIHIYPTPGLYTVSLTVSGANGTDTRIKRDLIAVGSLAEIQADNRDPEFVNTPAFWLSMAISPAVATFLALRDHVDRRRQAGQGVATDGHGLVALIQARKAGTGPGAIDLAVEAFLDGATRARHRLDGSALDHLNQSTGIVDALQRLLLIEAVVQKVKPDDGRLTAMNQAIEERLGELASTLDGLSRETE